MIVIRTTSLREHKDHRIRLAEKLTYDQAKELGFREALRLKCPRYVVESDLDKPEDQPIWYVYCLKESTPATGVAMFAPNFVPL